MRHMPRPSWIVDGPARVDAVGHARVWKEILVERCFKCAGRFPQFCGTAIFDLFLGATCSMGFDLMLYRSRR